MEPWAIQIEKLLLSEGFTWNLQQVNLAFHIQHIGICQVGGTHSPDSCSSRRRGRCIGPWRRWPKFLQLRFQPQNLSVLVTASVELVHDWRWEAGIAIGPEEQRQVWHRSSWPRSLSRWAFGRRVPVVVHLFLQLRKHILLFLSETAKIADMRPLALQALLTNRPSKLTLPDTWCPWRIDWRYYKVKAPTAWLFSEQQKWTPNLACWAAGPTPLSDNHQGFWTQRSKHPEQPGEPQALSWDKTKKDGSERWVGGSLM